MLVWKYIQDFKNLVKFKLKIQPPMNMFYLIELIIRQLFVLINFVKFNQILLIQRLYRVHFYVLL